MSPHAASIIVTPLELFATYARFAVQARFDGPGGAPPQLHPMGIESPGPSFHLAGIIALVVEADDAPVLRVEHDMREGELVLTTLNGEMMRAMRAGDCTMNAMRLPLATAPTSVRTYYAHRGPDGVWREATMHGLPDGGRVWLCTLLGG